ncbi:hypothetical protein [Sphingomonas sp. Marseille-Q8236]
MTDAPPSRARGDGLVLLLLLLVLLLMLRHAARPLSFRSAA